MLLALRLSFRVMGSGNLASGNQGSLCVSGGLRPDAMRAEPEAFAVGVFFAFSVAEIRHIRAERPPDDRGDAGFASEPGEGGFVGHLPLVGSVAEWTAGNSRTRSSGGHSEGSAPALSRSGSLWCFCRMTA